MAVVNITVENDSDFYRWFGYQTTDGAPIDLSGATMLMKARRHAQDITALLELSTDTGEIVILQPPTNGMFTVMIAQQRSVQLGLGSYDQSLIMTQNGIKQLIWSGTLVVNPGPSR
jgi:hypothetical protein